MCFAAVEDDEDWNVELSRRRRRELIYITFAEVIMEVSPSNGDT
jgi:hypothetical protein